MGKVRGLNFGKSWEYQQLTQLLKHVTYTYIYIHHYVYICIYIYMSLCMYVMYVCMVWCGVVWYGVVWCGMVWYGMECNVM